MNRNGTLSIPFVLIIAAVSGFAGGGSEAASSAGSSGTNATPIGVADAVATVNGEPIPRAEFDRIVAAQLHQGRFAAEGQVAPERRAAVRQQVLEALITQRVLLQRAAAAGVQVEPEAVDAMIDEVQRQFPTEQEFLIVLGEQGLTPQDFRLELENQLKIERLIDREVDSDVSVTDEEVRAFYDQNPRSFEQGEQVAARHILFTSDTLETEAERAAAGRRLAAIRADIVAGADFGDMAREHSQGPSGPSGGDLGVFGRGQMVAEFEAVAFGLAVGEVSEVFETAFGFHIVQVTDRIEAVTIGFDEAEPRIVEFLLERGRNEAAGRYVAELRADAQVETFGAED